MWTPPATREPAELVEQMADQLASYGARPWQVELTAALLAGAVLAGDVPA